VTVRDTVQGDQILVEVFYPKSLLVVSDGGKPPVCTWARTAGGRHLESNVDHDEAIDRWQFDTIESASAFMGETISRFEGALFGQDSTPFFGQPFRVVYQGKQAAAGRLGQKTSGHVD
jgi:hypothetical protein